MRHYIITSSDGSDTMKLEEFDECYHSTNGAFAEACHIYIHNGIEHLWKKIRNFNIENASSNSIVIYDIGIGTALNCISTLLWQQSLSRNNKPAPHIHYIGIEKYPIPVQEAMQLNFPEHLSIKQHILYPDDWNMGNAKKIAPPDSDSKDYPAYYREENVNKLNLFDKNEIALWFKAIHTAEWEKDVEITKGFTLTKIKGDVAECTSEDFRSTIYPNSPSIIYYDTFSPATQPSLWDKSIFLEIFKGVNNHSLLTTYCAKGIVKQALRDVGFIIERLPGPPGKRHILRATKES